MAENKIPVSDQLLLKWRRQGKTYQEIADLIRAKHGVLVHRTTVNRRLATLGQARQIGSHRNLLPWRIKSEHYNMHMADMLRMWAREQQGLPLDENARRVKQMRRLVQMLESAEPRRVVTYSPEPFTAAGGKAFPAGFYIIRAEEDEHIVTSRHSRFAPAPELWSS